MSGTGDVPTDVCVDETTRGSCGKSATWREIEREKERGRVRFRQQPLGSRGVLELLSLDWTEPLPPRVVDLAPLDAIICSDCLFRAALHAPLATTLFALLDAGRRRDPRKRTEVLLAFQLREDVLSFLSVRSPLSSSLALFLFFLRLSLFHSRDTRESLKTPSFTREGDFRIQRERERACYTRARTYRPISRSSTSHSPPPDWSLSSSTSTHSLKHCGGPRATTALTTPSASSMRRLSEATSSFTQSHSRKRLPVSTRAAYNEHGKSSRGK